MHTEERLALQRPITFAHARLHSDRRVRLSYRPALDGLRATAVLAVFAYHLDLIPGGFLGVDVFFVLSGFLITTILLREHDETGRIALGAFWARRARRLLPALLLVLVAVELWVWSTAAPFELPQRRADLLWTLFYAGNWNLIASAQDYFAHYGSASMLRHTWSLAVEEQFYLIWPLVVFGALWLFRGRTRALLTICGLGAIGSVCLMAWLYTPADPSRAYFGTETRVHQLLIGALLAIVLTRVHAVASLRRSASAAALAGFGALLISFVWFGDHQAAYYAGASAAVALGAAFVLWGVEVAPNGVLARGLGLRPLRWIGKVSYGVYLWHWPLIVAITAPAAVLAWLPGSLGLTVTRVALTLGFAAASYRFVERPVREGRLPWVRDSAPRVALAAVIATVVIGSSIVSVTDPHADEASANVGSAEIDELACSLQICARYVADDQAPVVAVIGDSVARSLDVGMLDLARERGFTYLIAASGGCRITHLLSMVDGDTEIYEPCFEATPGLWTELIDRWHPDLVVALDMFETNDFVDARGATQWAGSPDHLAGERRALGALADLFTAAGARLAFVNIPPVVKPPDCLRLDSLESDRCARPVSSDPRLAAFNEMLGSVVRSHPTGTYLVSVTPHVCPDGVCRPMVDGLVPRYDGVHFSAAGARWAVRLLYEDLIQSGALNST